MQSRLGLYGIRGAVIGSAVGFSLSKLFSPNEDYSGQICPSQHFPDDCSKEAVDGVSQGFSAWTFMTVCSFIGGSVGIIYGAYLDGRDRISDQISDQKAQQDFEKNNALIVNPLMPEVFQAYMAAHKAKKAYQQDMKGTNCFFGAARREDVAQVDDILSGKLEKELAEGKDAMPLLQRYVQTTDSLWKCSPPIVQYQCVPSQQNLFSNYFLTCLRYENIEVYRKVVGEAFGISFVSDAITLYRRDKRWHKFIFWNGFKLWGGEINHPYTPKICYAEPVTHCYGVSFSTKILDLRYNYGSAHFYYVVKLPPKHNFLLVDIVKSPRNFGKVRTDLAEINSMDDIPGSMVEKCVFTSPSSRSEIENAKFSEKDVVRRHRKMGCY
jgi:hypothetical protein